MRAVEEEEEEEDEGRAEPVPRSPASRDKSEAVVLDEGGFEEDEEDVCWSRELRSILGPIVRWSSPDMPQSVFTRVVRRVRMISSVL
jgi:hypothetical protein